MDRVHYIDDFERLLKDAADELRMHPSKKNWRSLYNNIYPGRRYPSLAMSILLISTIIMLGYSNTGNSKKNSFYSTGNVAVRTKPLYAQLQKQPRIHTSDAFATITLLAGKDVLLSIKDGSKKQQADNPSSGLQHHFTIDEKSSTVSTVQQERKGNDIDAEDFSTSVGTVAKNILSDEEKIWAASLAPKDKPAEKKWIDKFGWQVYAAPSIVSGTTPFNNSSDQNNYATAIGLEAGTAMKYPVSRTIQLTAGLQFNYIGYNTGNRSGSPTVVFNDPNTGIPYTESKITPEGNAAAMLQNETYQFSIPLGLELKLAHVGNLQWSMGATIQPTFVAGGTTYLLSPDNQSYVEEGASMLNRWNLNGGLETFITYQTKSGLTWQFGPQFRYQFLSTYNKRYSTLDENLTNYGIKIGVSKTIH